MSYGRRSRYHRAKENGKRVKGTEIKFRNIGGEIPGGCLYSPEWESLFIEPAIGEIFGYGPESYWCRSCKTIISEEYQSIAAENVRARKAEKLKRFIMK